MYTFACFADMENILKEALGSVTLTPSGRRGGGCINQGEAFLVDSGTVFVKSNSKKNVKTN
jgi:fructosamine-3-kinase